MDAFDMLRDRMEKMVDNVVKAQCAIIESLNDDESEDE